MDDHRESLGELRTRLRAGQSLEVAGYTLSAGLARELSEVSTDSTIGGLAKSLHWMEVARDPQAGTSAAAAGVLAHIRASGESVEFAKFSGEPFWSSTEIVVNPSLIAATCQALGPP